MPVIFVNEGPRRLLDKRIVVRPLQGRQRPVHLRNVLLGHVIGIRSRISDHFMLLVKRLRQVERFFRAEAVFAVRFALQQSQVIQLVRIFARILDFIAGYSAGPALDFGRNLIRPLTVGDPFSPPFARISCALLGEAGLYFIIG
ncbi:Uncharacterised protein [Chlamydia abortus]|nr:Uncharacterised protein [Chlamydia abortus]